MFGAENVRPGNKSERFKTGVSNSFSPGGHISLTVAFKGPSVIVGLFKCNYSSTVKRELGTAAG